MKKLVITVAIVIAAAVSQAATISWSINNIQSSPDTAVAAGWLVQIYAASSAYSYDDAKSGAITAVYSETSVASGTFFKASQSGVGNYAANESISLYAVIYDAGTVADAKNYIVSETLTKSINAAGSPQTFSFGNMASTATSNLFRNSTWSAAAVPEPTSGLLILLGMAGLALRRRRA